MQVQLIDIKKLKNNTGQIEGLPKNPRLLKDDKFWKLVKSIQEDPEMLDLREIIAYDNDGELVVICGNMRLKASKEANLKEVPVKILPTNTPIQKLKAYTIKDNVSFGENDWEDLANNWNAEELSEWGLDIPDIDKIDKLEDGEELEFEQSVQLIPPKEYIMIMAEPNSEEWEEIKEVLKLKMVRRGGYRKGSAFDAIGLERVLYWNEFKNRLYANSDTQ
jgi:ParB-like chromosome segregation protein Spo0J